MNRSSALLASGAGTMAFLVAMVGGLAVGLSLAGGGAAWPPPTLPMPDAVEIAELALWVGLLMAPAVVFLERRRHLGCPVTIGLTAAIALVKLVRLRVAGDDLPEALVWGALDGILFALGFLVFGLLFSFLSARRDRRDDSAAAPRA